MENLKPLNNIEVGLCGLELDIRFLELISSAWFIKKKLQNMKLYYK